MRDGSGRFLGFKKCRQWDGFCSETSAISRRVLYHATQVDYEGAIWRNSYIFLFGRRLGSSIGFEDRDKDLISIYCQNFKIASSLRLFAGYQEVCYDLALAMSYEKPSFKYLYSP